MSNVYLFNLPVFDNMGRELPSIHRALKMSLCRAFGGYTMTPNLEGGWIDPHDGALFIEPVHSYRVTTDSDGADSFVAIATHYARLAGQIAAYVEVNGAARVITLEAEANHA